MKSVSSDYKKIMNRPIRNRAYVSIGLGVVNQDAQKDAAVSTECVNWCNPNAIFENNTGLKIYATMEQNFMKADGSMVFMPEKYLQQHPFLQKKQSLPEFQSGNALLTFRRAAQT